MEEKRTDIDDLVLELVLNDTLEAKTEIFNKILQQAEERGIFLASIHPLYRARGRGDFSGFTVPAINLRTLTYDLARAIFRVPKRNQAGAFIFEIAKGENGDKNSTAEELMAFTLTTLSRLAREKFGLAGAVQHGTSTLPEEVFHKFPEIETAEIHLATQFQNIYKTRKKALGQFKKEIVVLKPEIREAIAAEVEEKIAFLFKQLNVANTLSLNTIYVPDDYAKKKSMGGG